MRKAEVLSALGDAFGGSGGLGSVWRFGCATL